MAGRSAFSVQVRDVEQLAARVSNLDEAVGSGSGLARALNTLAGEVYVLARGRMVAGINLSDEYVRSRMRVEEAEPGSVLRASIVAFGGREYQTPLGRYFSRQLTVSAPRSKGDPSRGISPGKKAAGVAVSVQRGSEKPLLHGFTMPLRRGSEAGGNGVGLFARTKYGIVRHRYGPAVYQLFRVAAGDLESEINNRMTTLAAEAERALVEILNS